MSAAMVEVLTVDEAIRRRAEVLESIGGDEAVLRERAAAFSLDAQELVALEQIDELDYLLGR